MTLRAHLSGLRLPADNHAVGSAVGMLVDDVVCWRSAAREYACAVRACADRYVDNDRRDARGLR